MSSINPTSSSRTSSQSKKRNHHGSSADSSSDDDLPRKIQKLPMIKKKILSENVAGEPTGEVEPARRKISLILIQSVYHRTPLRLSLWK